MLTIEPGFYAKEKYGIRIENCYETVEAVVMSKAQNFLTFKVYPDPRNFINLLISVSHFGAYSNFDRRQVSSD